MVENIANNYGVMLNHRSVRDYQVGKEIPREQLELIFKSINNAPTSINGQTISVINIVDKNLRKKVAELCWNQRHIVECSTFLIFCMDFYKVDFALKQKNLEMKIHESVESLMVGSVDNGIALGITTMLAEAMGLYTCCIGAVRQNLQELSDLLNLPQYVVPMVGMCLGYAKEDLLPSIKPKMPISSFVMDDSYDKKVVESNIVDYNKIMQKYFTERGGEIENVDWTDKIANFYTKVYYPEEKACLEKKGFSCKL